MNNVSNSSEDWRKLENPQITGILVSGGRSFAVNSESGLNIAELNQIITNIDNITFQFSNNTSIKAKELAHTLGYSDQQSGRSLRHLEEGLLDANTIVDTVKVINSQIQAYTTIRHDLMGALDLKNKEEADTILNACLPLLHLLEQTSGLQTDAPHQITEVKLKDSGPIGVERMRLRFSPPYGQECILLSKRLGQGAFKECFLLYSPVEKTFVIYVKKTEQNDLFNTDLDIQLFLNSKNIRNIPKVLYSTDGFAYMEYAGTRALRLCCSNRIEDQDRQAVGLAVSEALTDLHALKIAHRDISLDNICIKQADNKSSAMLIDFSLAAKVPGTIKFRHNKFYINPPEVYLRGECDFLSFDLYSFGLAMFHLEFGRRYLERRSNMYDENGNPHSQNEYNHLYQENAESIYKIISKQKDKQSGYFKIFLIDALKNKDSTDDDQLLEEIDRISINNHDENDLRTVLNYLDWDENKIERTVILFHLLQFDPKERKPASEICALYQKLPLQENVENNT